MQPQPTEAPSLAATVRSLVHHVLQVISAGDRAELRRMRPGELEPPAFWRIIAGPLAPTLANAGSHRESQEQRWALIIAAIARGGTGHNGARGLGVGLAGGGVTELRLMKLLRADHGRLGAQIFSMVQLMVAKASPINWIDLALLILSSGRSDSDIYRRRIARDYFAAID